MEEGEPGVAGGLLEIAWSGGEIEIAEREGEVEGGGQGADEFGVGERLVGA